MCAATTKILHLLYEKGLLKTPNEMYDFYLQLMIYVMGIGEKPRNIQKIQKRKQRKKFPVGLPSHPPVYEMEADCFPVSENAENKPDLP